MLMFNCCNEWENVFPFKLPFSSGNINMTVLWLIEWENAPPCNKVFQQTAGINNYSLDTFFFFKFKGSLEVKQKKWLHFCFKRCQKPGHHVTALHMDVKSHVTICRV